MNRPILKRVLIAVIMVVAVAVRAYAGEVTLAWDPNTEPDIAGYRVWYGTQSRVYSNVIDVGNRTTWTVTNLADGQRYFFAVQAYNASLQLSPLSAEVLDELPVPTPAPAPAPPPTVTPGTGTTLPCPTVRPGANWSCDPATGNWLPPGMGATSTGTSSGTNTGTSVGSTGFCTTVRPGADWTCDVATGNWLPPGSGGTSTGTSSATSSGSARGCTTVRPGADWTCDVATGNWLPPGMAATSSGSGSGTSTGTSSGASTGGCETVRPGADWTCDVANGNWLPPGYRTSPAGLHQGELIYLYQSITGGGLTGWTVLRQSATTQFDAFRNNVRIGQWSFNPAAGAAQFTAANPTGSSTTPGAPDLVAWQPATGVWYVLKSADATIYVLQGSLQWGDGGAKDLPVPGDYDADRRTDLAVWWPSAAMWYVLKSTEGYDSQRNFTIQWGENGDVPVQGDYDGDGKTDPAVWRPSLATWNVLKSTEGYDYTRGFIIQWGENGDVPAQGDYDGDGKTDIAVWRSSISMTLVLKSSEGFNLQRCLAVQSGTSTAVSPCPVTVTVR